MAIESMPEVVELEVLREAWFVTKTALDEAQAKLDMQALKYLEDRGARPTRDLMDIVEECRHQEHEARGQVDHFIAEMP